MVENTLLITGQNNEKQIKQNKTARGLAPSSQNPDLPRRQNDKSVKTY